MESEKRRVLIVEDNPGDVRMVRDIFEKQATGQVELVHEMFLEKALKRLSSESFSFILLDLFLIDSFGLETVTKVREAAPQTPIIVLTGFYDRGVATLAIDMGAKYFFEKDHLQGPALLSAMRDYAKAG